MTTVYTTNSLGDVTKQEIFNGAGGVSVENVEYTYDGNHNMIKKENKNGSTVLQREEYEPGPIPTK